MLVSGLDPRVGLGYGPWAFPSLMCPCPPPTLLHLGQFGMTAGGLRLVATLSGVQMPALMMVANMPASPSL